MTAALVSGIRDGRDPAKVRDLTDVLVSERVFAIVGGYPDANDLDFLRRDPVMKTVCGLAPQSGADLASQPTISRLEHSLSCFDLACMGKGLMKAAIGQLPRGTKRVILDVDATDDPVYGQQPFEIFNGYYGCHCYLPVHLYVTGPDGRKRVLASLLRPGNASATVGLFGLMRMAVRLLQKRFGNIRIVLRGDCAYGIDEVIRWCEKHRIKYALGLSSNSKLMALGTPVMLRVAVRKSVLKTDPVEYAEFLYQTKTWPHARRVIVKAEDTDGKLNPRFVVTNLTWREPRHLYRLYCARGECENRIKELKLDLFSGRTSCTSFLANQARLILHTAAQVLMQAIQDAAAGTELARAQAGTLRLCLLKVGARVIETARRIWFHLPSSYPWQRVWQTVVANLVAV